MPDYMVVKQTIPPNTPQSNPIVIKVDVNDSIVVHRECLFPKNAAMLCGVQLWDHAGRFWPSQGSPSEWITGDNEKASSDVPFMMRGGGPYQVVVKLYNEDNTFERTPEIRFEVESTSLQQLLQQLIDTLGATLLNR